MSQTYQQRLKIGNKLSNVVLKLPIVGFEHYVVSKDGRVFNTLDTHYNILSIPKEVKGHVNSVTGYIQVTLQNKKLGINLKKFIPKRCLQ